MQTEAEESWTTDGKIM